MLAQSVVTMDIDLFPIIWPFGSASKLLSISNIGNFILYEKNKSIDRRTDAEDWVHETNFINVEMNKNEHACIQCLN